MPGELKDVTTRTSFRTMVNVVSVCVNLLTMAYSSTHVAWNTQKIDCTSVRIRHHSTLVTSSDAFAQPQRLYRRLIPADVSSSHA